jgi:hypothetical protein
VRQLQAPTEASRHTLRREHGLLAGCIVLLLLATIPPLINLGRFQHRIAGAISRAIGRPVSMDSISLRLLPWPAFRIQNFNVGEEPGFGAEPALRAPEVIAEPRLSSLWRGRFELDRVEIADASVNLVRNDAGRWNISSVLLQASHIPNAPTAQPHPGPAPRFTYIQATGTRINFKRNVEKLPYSLLNADFSMSLARPDVWRLKLEGQPVRTDLELSAGDTGAVRLEGELHRASAFGTMPLSLQAEWSHAPLGQLSRILGGSDANWRGDVDLTAQFKGEIDHLDVRTHLLLANLHRQEFTPDQPFTIDATCRGHYSRSNPLADAFRCRWPLADGSLLLTHEPGDVSGALTITADKVPASVIAAAGGLLRPGAPRPGRFNGEISGSYTWDSAKAPAGNQLTGSASAPMLELAGTGPDNAHLVLTELQLTAGPGPALLITSKPLSLGVPGAPMALSAELSRHGYSLHANGAGTLRALQAAATALRLPNLPSFSPVSADTPATARLALTISGIWLRSEGAAEDAPESAPATGTVHLENVRWSAPWLPFPVTLGSLDAALSPGLIRWTAPAALFGDDRAPLRLSGHAQLSLPCNPQTGCATEFSVSTASLDGGLLGRALSGSPRPQLLSALLNRFNGKEAHLPTLSGSVHAGVLTLGRLPVRDASLVLTTEAAGIPSVTIQSLDGHALGGSLHLHGTLSLERGEPRYALQASLTGANATQAAALWHENWGPGTLSGTANFELTGTTAADLMENAKGSFQATWLDGDLSPALPHFENWTASGSLTPDGLRLEHSTLSPTSAALSGTIGWNRALGLQLVPVPDGTPIAISGTLAEPVTVPSEATGDATP